MAITLELTDGTTTLELDGSGGDTYGGVTYAPEPPAVSALDAVNSSITETVIVQLSGTSSEIATAIRAIETMVRQARRRQVDGTGDRVYLNYAPYSVTAYRSEVLDGRLSLDSDPNRRQFSVGTVMVTIDLERRAYWESASEVEIVTEETLINDGTNSHVVIDSADIDGVIPSPAKITLENTSGTSIYWSRFWLSCNAFNDPNTFGGIFAGASLSWTGPATKYAAKTWSLTAATLDDCQGDYFRVLAAFDTTTYNVPTDIYWTARIKYSVTELIAGDPAWTGPGLTKGLFDLGALPFPPGGNFTANAALSLVLAVTAEATGQCDLDFLQIIPAGEGRLRTWYQRGYAAANGAKIVDDPYGGIIYYEESSLQTPLITAKSGPLMLWPGRDNRISVLFDESDANVLFSSARTTKISVSHRPRRLAL